MKWLIVPLLWLVAGMVAVAVLWRLYRGKNVVLRGKWSPRVIRIVAILLVVLGLPGTPPADSAEPPTMEGSKKPDSQDELPAFVTPAQIGRWIALETSPQNEGGVRGARQWPTFKKSMTQAFLTAPNEQELTALAQSAQGHPKPLAGLFQADLNAIAQGKPLPPVTADALAAVLNQVEETGYYDHWLNAYLWRKTAQFGDADRPRLAEIYPRLHRLARLTDAFIRGQGETRPYVMSARAWMGKAGPSQTEVLLVQKGAEDLLKSVTQLYPGQDAGTWKYDSVILLTLPKDAPSLKLLQAGRERTLAAGDTVRFGRLDLLRTPDQAASIDVAGVGHVTLPANRTISVWQLPDLLSPEGQGKLQQTVQKALDGDSDAADSLELILPFAHSALHGGLEKSPNAKLAPRLRMILSLFDDAVMPTLTAAAANPPEAGR